MPEAGGSLSAGQLPCTGWRRIVQHGDKEQSMTGSYCAHVIAGADEMELAVGRLAQQIINRHGDCVGVGLIGIQRRGADLATRIKGALDTSLGRKVPLGKLDINLYRDDWSDLTVQPRISCSEIPYDVTGKTVVLIDDVLFTGRTIRAAMEAVLDWGRPRKVELLCLVDRGCRELPIQPDYVGFTIDTLHSDHVDVLVRERDAEDQVCLRRSPEAERPAPMA